MALSTFSLWELFPIGSGRSRRNAHARKAGPGRRTIITTKHAKTPRKRLRCAVGIGDWKGKIYLSYHAHDAQRSWKAVRPGAGPVRKPQSERHVGPGEYLRRVCGIDTTHMDEADIYLHFLGVMKRLAVKFG